MTNFSFSYNHKSESFRIAGLDDSRAIVLPRDAKLCRVTHWPIWPQPLFLHGKNGTEISVNGDMHHGKSVLFQNRKEDWFVRLERQEVFVWLDRPHDVVIDGEICPQNSTRVDLERTTIEL